MRLDALILENELIKENQPRYNMRLKDDKSFPYVAIDSRSDFPAPLHHARQAREGRALLRSLRRRAGAARDDGRASPGLPPALVHEAQVQLPAADRAALPACTTSASARVPAWAPSTREGYQELVAVLGAFLRGRRAPAARTAGSTRWTTRPQQKHYEAAAKARDGLAALERAASAPERRAGRPLEPRRDRHRHRRRSRRGRALSGSLRADHRTHRPPDRPFDGRERRARSSRASLPDLYDDADVVPRSSSSPTPALASDSGASFLARTCARARSRSSRPSAAGDGACSSSRPTTPWR